MDETICRRNFVQLPVTACQLATGDFHKSDNELLADGTVGILLWRDGKQFGFFFVEKPLKKYGSDEKKSVYVCAYNCTSTVPKIAKQNRSFFFMTKQ
jgi:hypothetical protein